MAKTALIIDDDPIFQLVAEEALNALGFLDVSIADDGALGVERVQNTTTPYDLVICDLQMPNLDGVSVMRELATIGFAGDLIIASSEDNDIIGTVRRMAQMVGVRVIGTIRKPISVAAIEALLVASQQLVMPSNEGTMTRHSLKTALGEGRIVPYYQPKLDLASGKIKAAEVLARHIGPDGKPRSPTSSLSAAEQFNLIPAFTHSIIEQVIADARRWQIVDGLQLDLSINISPAMLDDLELPDMLANRFRSAGIETRSITLEVTEDRVLNYNPSVLEVLSRLRLHGFKLSIDDFGTGATSIEHLKLYPFNELKIDQTFVLAALEDEFARTTVETSVRLATMLNMSIVAEGVETAEQMAFVREAGAHSVQGFLVSRPLAKPELVTFLTEFDAPKQRMIQPL